MPARAAEARGELVLDNTNASAVRDLCVRLDGILASDQELCDAFAAVERAHRTGLIPAQLYAAIRAGRAA
mgnify:CR=1 FL=1